MIDGAASAAPSPMQAPGFALAGFMAMDMVHILKKGRHDLEGLKARLVADALRRSRDNSASVALHFTVTGAVPRNRFSAPSISSATSTVQSGALFVRTSN